MLGSGFATFVECKKWVATKSALKHWNRSHFGNIKWISAEIDHVQRVIPSPTALDTKASL
jgi:hypothetical protein